MKSVTLTMEDVEIYLIRGVFPQDDVCHAVLWSALHTFHKRTTRDLVKKHIQDGRFSGITVSGLSIRFESSVCELATKLLGVHDFLRDADLEEFQIIREKILPSPELMTYLEMCHPLDARFADYSEWLKRDFALARRIAKELYNYDTSGHMDHVDIIALQPSLRIR